MKNLILIILLFGFNTLNVEASQSFEKIDLDSIVYKSVYKNKGKCEKVVLDNFSLLHQYKEMYKEFGKTAYTVYFKKQEDLFYRVNYTMNLTTRKISYYWFLYSTSEKLCNKTLSKILRGTNND